MILVRPLLLLALLGSLTQDPDVRDILRRLEDDNADVREKAQKELGSLGDGAIPALKEAADSPRSSGELKFRIIAAIKQIELSGKIAKIYQEPRPITLQASGAMLRDVLDDLQRQAGVVIESSLVDPASKITLDVKDASLQRILDLLCKDQTERTWEAQDDGSIRLLKDRHPSAPAAYGGPFRLRVQSLSVERATDFKGKTVSVTATLAADWDKRLKPSKIVDIDLAKASDGQGSAIDISAADSGVLTVRGVPGAQIRIAGVNFPEPGENTRAFSLKNVSPTATQLDLEGVARFTFPLDYKDIRVDRPGTVESRDLGDTTVRIARGGATEIWSVSFHKNPSASTPSWSRTIAQRFDADSFVVVDTDGNEFTGTLRSPSLRGRQMDFASESSVWYQAAIPRNPSLPIREVRFRFVEQTLVKTLPFKFSGLALP
ncbi:MAG TPA: HEAT repeat domain-containing protein [Planctomycetota bacterium]|nr:HEAT repeat domain-containing protein [Planctomycetota bacterium]